MSTTEATTTASGIIPGTVAVAHLHTGDSITGSFAASLDDLYRYDEKGTCLFPPIRNECGADIAAGRRQATEAFLRHSPGEWLWMVDDDMGFAPDIVQRLLEVADPVKAPVVGGLCFKQSRNEVSAEKAQRYSISPTMYALVETSNDIGYAAVADWQRDAVRQVDGTGAACLLIHRSVLQGMTDLEGEGWAGRLFDGESPWWEPVVIPKGRIAGATRLSEDLSFCFRCKVAGVPIFVNTAAKTSHKKPVYLDEWYYDNQPLRLVEPGIVVVGTGRSGSNFIADALALAGVTCGHEGWWNTFGTRGPALMADSSWVAANYLDDYKGTVWHQVRHPLKVINSLIGNELFEEDGPDWVIPFEEERRRWAGYDPDDPVEVKALRVVAHWLEVCEKHAERTWRVEDMTAGFLLELVDAAGVEIPLRHARQILDQLGTNTNKHPDGDAPVTWADLPDNDDKAYIEKLAATWGYDLDAA